MTDHTWADEHIPAYLAGALTAPEAERLEAHAAACGDCSDALAAARDLDRELSGLFADVRPGPDLEDRTVDRLRTETPMPAPAKPLLSRWSARGVAAVAAVVFVGAFGALAGTVAQNGLPMPGGGRVAKKAARSEGIRTYNVAGGEAPTQRDAAPAIFGDLVNEDPGLQSNLEAALPAIDRIDKQTVDAAVTADNLGQPNAPDTDTTALTSTSGGSGYSSFPGRSGSTRSVLLRDPYPTKPVERPTGATPPVVPVVPTPVVPVSGPVPPGDPKAPPVPTAPKPDPAGGEAPPKPEPGFDPAPEPTKRVVIRTGNMEFEVPSFDAAAATVTRSVLAIKGAFVATVNSDKLPNGKVKGAITVRVPPEHLDSLVLELRKELGKDGELKGVRITSQDVTKQYTDTESRLRGARTMETRLIQIIKEGKGEIKQLLEAERELGVWRTRIEEFEGELRYYASLASLSTLTVSLAEKEIRAAASITENERVQAGVEVDDVDKTYQDIIKAVSEAKGRVTKSEVKQLAAGQFNASLNFEVPPDASGPIRDRLKQLGRVARLEIDRVQRPEGGTLPTDAKLTRGDAVFLVSLYNLANIAPRETVTLQVAVTEVPTAFEAVRAAVGKTTSRVSVAKFDEQDRSNATAQLDFEVRRTDEGAVKAALDAAGETVTRQLTRAAEGDSVTDSKVLYRVTVLPMARLRPRDTASLNVAVADVPAAYQALRDAVTKANARVLNAQINEQDRQNITAVLDVEMKRADEAAVRAAFDAAGDVLARQVTRAAEADGVTDSKVRYTATLTPASRLKPRETTALGIEVANVDEAATLFAAQAAEVKGRQADARFSRDASGKTLAKLAFDVPLTAAAGLVEKFKAAGTVRAAQSARDPQATDGRFATARVEVTLGNRESIISDDDGLWSQVRRGLSYSASVLLTSVTWVVFGLCVVLPWAVIGYVAYRIVRRTVAPAPAAPTPAPAPTPPAA
jgi:hypothetical protein